ncbi:hypothetical protein [Nitrosomonas sp.]|uniref:hypothetical protein n=1 Tax=Nitrosomonas sp. TaxID=42353 RepID=UPI0032EED293
MNDRITNLLHLMGVFREDFHSLLDLEGDTPFWRRSFIRLCVPCFEGQTNCLIEICALSHECQNAVLLTKREKMIFGKCREKLSLKERIKYTLRVTYKLLELDTLPDFNACEWHRLAEVFDKRNALTHPKKLADLEISDSSFGEIKNDVVWLLKQFDNIFIFFEGKNKYV